MFGNRYRGEVVGGFDNPSISLSATTTRMFIVCKDGGNDFIFNPSQTGSANLSVHNGFASSSTHNNGYVSNSGMMSNLRNITNGRALGIGYNALITTTGDTITDAQGILIVKWNNNITDADYLVYLKFDQNYSFSSSDIITYRMSGISSDYIVDTNLMFPTNVDSDNSVFGLNLAQKMLYNPETSSPRFNGDIIIGLVNSSFVITSNSNADTIDNSTNYSTTKIGDGVKIKQNRSYNSVKSQVKIRVDKTTYKFRNINDIAKGYIIFEEINRRILAYCQFNTPIQLVNQDLVLTLPLDGENIPTLLKIEGDDV